MTESVLEFFESEVFGDREKEAFPLLSKIDSPTDLKKVPAEDLDRVCSEMRHFIIQTLSRTGGHLGSNLGTVELATALHYVFNFKTDRICWDVGHQAYPHKILTGRRGRFGSLRQYKGLSGFLKRDESEYDHFGAGHASTSISAALGMATARDLNDEKHHCMAVIGDGAMTGGMAFEALNQLGYLKKKVIVILNDNDMSISPNVGALSGYLNQLISGQFYTRTREHVEKTLKMIPGIGDKIARRAGKLEHIVKKMLVPGSLFQELGFHYFGPVNGHHVESLIKTFEQAKEVDGPTLIHLRTVKGKGFGLAEELSETYHGVKVGYLPKKDKSVPVPKPGKSAPSYTKVFAQTLCEIAEEDKRVIGVTAAMPTGTGLNLFAKSFPNRYFDVGIAEQHAVTFAAGMATHGKKPVAAIYSTFLQRAYDQIIHDVCIQNLDVTFCMDRGGLVGADGPTHHGVFDIGYLRIIPNLIVMAPADENELRHMVYTAIKHDGPTAVRYPRGNGLGVDMDEPLKAIPIGKGEMRRKGKDMLLIGYGNMVNYLEIAAEQLAEEHQIECAVMNARFVKPLDVEMVLSNLPQNKQILTLEDGNLMGGFGSAVIEELHEKGVNNVKVTRLGIRDHFVTHGDIKNLHREQHMDSEAVVQAVLKMV